jgi:5-formyltetrahydrofolate cyclo-ligase
MIVPSAVAPLSKAALRRQALARRDALGAAAVVPEPFVACGQKLAARLGAAVIAGYWPLRSEAPALALLTALANAGIMTALPAVTARGAPLVFRRWQPGDPTAPDAHGIPAPSHAAPALPPDLLFVPLAAFDRTGHRIGAGAGYYDRALEALRRTRRIHAVGLAFAVQEIERVPHEPHDQRLDYVITERELIDCSDG